MAQVVESDNFGQVRTPVRFWKREDWLMRKRSYCKKDCMYKLITPAHTIPDFQIVTPTSPKNIISMYAESLDGSIIGALSGYIPQIFTIGDKDYICYDKINMPIDVWIYGHQFYAGAYGDNPNECGIVTKEFQIRLRYQDLLLNEAVEYISEPFVPMIESLGDNLLTKYAPVATGGWTWTGTQWCNASGTGTLTWTFPLTEWKKKYARFGIKTTTGAGLLTYASDGAGGNVGAVVPTFEQEMSFINAGTFVIDASAGWNGCIDLMELNMYSDQICDHHKLTWTNECDIFNMFNTPCRPCEDKACLYENLICYKADGYRRKYDGMLNEYFVPKEYEIGFPDIKLVEKVVLNGKQNENQTLKKRERRFHLEIGLIPEYLWEALMDIHYFETVVLSLKNGAGDEPIEPTTFEVGGNWEFDKCYNNANLSFGFFDDIADTSCCGTLPIQKCCGELACKEVDGFIEDFQDAEGEELISNGTFDTDLTGWHNGVSWAWDASGKIKHTAGSVDGFGQFAPLIVGKVYRVRFTVSGMTAGTLTPSLFGTAGQSDGTPITANGTYEQNILCTTGGTTSVEFFNNSAFDGMADSVSAKELSVLIDGHYYMRRSDGALILWSAGTEVVTECPSGIVSVIPFDITYEGDELIVNGTFDTDLSGWTISESEEPDFEWVEGKACQVEQGHLDNPFMSQVIASLVVGRTYKFEITISGSTTGFVTPKFDDLGAVGTNVSGNGTFSQEITYLGNTNTFILQTSPVFDGCIDNVSLRESLDTTASYCCNECIGCRKVVFENKFATGSGGWLLEGSATHDDAGDQINFNGAGSMTYLEHDILNKPLFLACHFYQFSFEIKNYVDGEVSLYVNGVLKGTYSADGIYAVELGKYIIDALEHKIELIGDADSDFDIDTTRLLDYGCIGTSACCYYLLDGEWIPMSGRITSMFGGIIQAEIPEGYFAFIEISCDDGCTWKAENLNCAPSEGIGLRVWTKDQLADGVPFCGCGREEIARLVTFNNNCDETFSEIKYPDDCHDIACVHVGGNIDEMNPDDLVDGHYYMKDDGTVVLWTSGSEVLFPCPNQIVVLDEDCPCGNAVGCGAALGSLVLNGFFNTDLSDWDSASVVWDASGKAHFNDGSNCGGYLCQTIETERCHTYRVKFDISGYTGAGNIGFFFMSQGGIPITADGHYEQDFVGIESFQYGLQQLCFSACFIEVMIDAVEVVDLGCAEPEPCAEDECWQWLAELGYWESI